MKINNLIVSKSCLDFDTSNQYHYVSQVKQIAGNSQVNKNTHITLKYCSTVMGQGLRREWSHAAYRERCMLVLVKFPFIEIMELSKRDETRIFPVKAAAENRELLTGAKKKLW